jgi:hypothetical protein
MQTTTRVYASEIAGYPPGFAFEYGGMYLFTTLEEPCLHLVPDGTAIVLKDLLPAGEANLLMQTIFSGLVEQLGGAQCPL